MAGPKYPLEQNSSMAPGGSLTEMLARIGPRAAQRKQGYGQGFDETAPAPRANINSLDSMAMSDAAQGIDIGSMIGGGGGGGNGMQMGSPDAYQDGPDEQGGYGDEEYDDGDGGGIPVQAAVMGEGDGPMQLAQCPGGVCPPQGGMPSQPYMSPSPQSLGLPPGARVISERVVSPGAPSPVAADPSVPAQPSYAQRMAELDAGLADPEITNDKMTRILAQKAALYRQQAEQAPDIVKRREFNGFLAVTETNLMNFSSRGVIANENAQKRALAREMMEKRAPYEAAALEQLEHETEAKKLANELAAIQKQISELSLPYSRAMEDARRQALREPGLSPQARALGVIQQQTSMFARSEIGEPGNLANANVNELAGRVAGRVKQEFSPTSYNMLVHEAMANDVSASMASTIMAGKRPLGGMSQEEYDAADPATRDEYESGMLAAAPDMFLVDEYYGRMDPSERADAIKALYYKLIVDMGVINYNDQVKAQGGKEITADQVQRKEVVLPPAIYFQAQADSVNFVRAIEKRLAGRPQGAPVSYPNPFNAGPQVPPAVRAWGGSLDAQPQ